MSESSKIILGIDPGTRVTGYGLLKKQGSKIEAIDFGCIRPPAKLELGKRYQILFESLETLIKKHRPNALSVETQFVQKNVASAMKISMARAMVLLAASRANIPYYEYAPRKAKLAVAGNGSASKMQLQKMLQMLLKLPQVAIPEDASDALAIAICHAHESKCLNI